jgi:hypothetical protein
MMTVVDALEDSILPKAGAVHARDCNPLTAELCPLPRAVLMQPLDQKSPAQWAYERLILYIRNFESRLDARQEVAVCFTGSMAGVTRIEGLGYFDPDIVTFYGQDETGVRTQLIQHVSQMNVTLRAVPLSDPENTARRIGFRLGDDWDVPKVKDTPEDAKTPSSSA